MAEGRQDYDEDEARRSRCVQALEELKQEYEELMIHKTNLELDMSRKRENIAHLATDLKHLYKSAAEKELHENLGDTESNMQQVDFDKETAAFIRQCEENENLEEAIRTLRHTGSALNRQCANLEAQLTEMYAG